MVPKSVEPVRSQSVVSVAVTSCGVTAHEPQLAPKSAEDESVQSVVSVVATVGVTAHEPAFAPKSVVPVSVQRVVSVVVTVGPYTPSTYAHVTVATNEDVQLSGVVQASPALFGVPAT